MFGLGTPEIIIILALALLLFGPKKLPEIGKSLGQGLRELRKASREIVDAVETASEEPQETKESINDVSNSSRAR
ncbi:twin-arginine translocase TatA/TatE family subunit [bacterium]|nr:twin-arginine translocase TatA/TatE family subunit [bacterium]